MISNLMIIYLTSYLLIIISEENNNMDASKYEPVMDTISHIQVCEEEHRMEYNVKASISYFLFLLA